MAAAPQAPGRGSVRKTRPLTVKTSLSNPYVICWSTLEREDMHFILQTLEDRFKSTGLQKIEDKKKRKRPPLTQKQGREKCSLDAGMTEDLMEEKPDAKRQVSGWTPVHVRRQLAIGINEVTRALESSDLLLALVCKSAKPAIITSHLIQLSLSRSVPACQVPRLSERIAPVIGLKCVLALGFRKGTSDFADEVRAIIPRVPSLNVPWFQERIKDSGEDRETESLDDQDKEVLETSCEDPSKHKRKLVEGRLGSAVALQPLKIKKLIPNPNKIRKPPKSKKTILK
ncbi:Ribonuclease P protein subunit p38 [Heterocephalus glaber]|uniref:Ribonuclease P protein subunit p38 n=1 Tax=Heterocephalus glaber TaxID=10181 RepID=G5C5D7_HETGA|nr:ribonuclease P protein subunit p38 [Heterocephalus glaber]XP_021097750.1 ribonuclease P protein subunit p38 [Heterocephalus glaber]XP_021097751.1 ribonuclease P protein subunit p38 [Heterocephalus glaber]XP_021097752.1 ribonuclease P protein subunit p38 [Heterocephalus glaber]EHB16748.1 Ribonuclease P protein subunit p38 [Heterocephalus glaber]